MTNGNGHSIYEFAEFTLDVHRLMLYRGETEISLPPKAVKTLAVLVESRGEILSKDELMQAVWEDSIVEESNLSQYLYILRKTLGQQPDGLPYIETLRRRGYRFNGEVHSSRGRSQPKVNAAETRHTELGVERHGNVLRLVDWTAQDKEDVPKIENVPLDRTPARPMTDLPTAAWLASVIVAAALLVSSAVLYSSYDAAPGAKVAEARNELSVVRMTNGGWPKSAAISPDGRYLAYTEAVGGISKIWLQAVGQSSRIEITASEKQIYQSKTFTPDGRFIYYGAVERVNAGHGSVYRIATTGGPSTKILDGTAGLVTFSPDGEEIAFMRVNLSAGSSSLAVADKDGRNERILLTRQKPISFVGSPAWSPDGSTIAFAEHGPGGTWNTGLCRIYALNLANGETRDLSNERWDSLHRIEWAKDGQGLVTVGTRSNESHTIRRDQVYYISLADGASRRVTSSGIRHEGDSLGTTIDGGIIALSGSRSSQIWSMDAAGGSNNAVQISKGLYDGRPGLAVLPDGRIGYITYADDNMGIWVMNPDGADARQITKDPPHLEELRSDPLGRYFFFSSKKDENSHLYRVDIDGGNLKQLTFGEGFEVDAAVSPDGNWLVYGSAIHKGSQSETRLYRTSVEGGEPEPIGDNECSRPHFSPHGDLLSCVTETDKEILIISAADGNRVAQLNVPAFAIVNFGVRWTPAGDEIVYIQTVKDVSNLWAQGVKGGEPRQLTNFTSGVIYNYAFSSDGTRILTARGYPLQEVLLITNYR